MQEACKFSVCAYIFIHLSVSILSISLSSIRASLTALLVKNLPVMQETLVRFLGQEDLLEKG